MLTCSAAADPLHIAVSIIPQQYLVSRIAGDLAHISVMIPTGHSPHAYEPKPAQMVSLSKANLFFSIGVSSENTWLPRFAELNRNMTIVDCTEGIAKIPMKSHHHEDDHHDQHKLVENQGALDPHVWLSPRRAAFISRNMLTAIIKADPANAETYIENYKKSASDIMMLDMKLLRLFSQTTGAFFVFHPAWGYLAHDYGLEQIPIELEGKEPKPRDLALLIATAKQKKIGAVFVQPQISKRAAEIIAGEINARVVVADPLAAEWMENLESVARAFAGELKQ
ncbi:MAG: zinc ABC transporter substrate-binding protein [Candidatus Wallbacteria bacterium]|nr:zinc ABC transporter substrate-binding protein [Candidatus Wallbacteria bacterium]